MSEKKALKKSCSPFVTGTQHETGEPTTILAEEETEPSFHDWDRSDNPLPYDEII